MERKKITFDSFIRGIISLGLIVAGLALLKQLSGVLLPFFIAWLLAYLIYPMVHFFQFRLRLRSRVLSVFCSLGLLTLVGVLGFYLLVPPMLTECLRVKDLLLDYFASQSGSHNIPIELDRFLHENISSDSVRMLFGDRPVLDALKEALPRVWAILMESINLLYSIFTLFIILLYVVFILIDYERISSGWVPLLHPKYRTATVRLLTDVKESMNRYFRGQALVATCVGVLFSIGFLLIDFPLAIGLGLFIGLLNMVPYLQVIGFLPTILLAILKAADTGGNFWVILASATAVFVVVQIIQDGFIVPRIMGRITGLNPAIILLSLSIWGSLMGMLGMIIALPLTTLMLSYYQRYIASREAHFPTDQPPSDEADD